MADIQVIVEFTSVSRMLTGQVESQLKVRPDITFTEIVSLLGKQFPALIGQIIDKNGNSFIATNLFSLNGQQILQESDMSGSPNDGDRLILVSLLAGG
jgi:hypothetical protein